MVILSAGIEQSVAGRHSNLTSDLPIGAGRQAARKIRNGYGLQSVVRTDHPESKNCVPSDWARYRDNGICGLTRLE